MHGVHTVLTYDTQSKQSLNEISGLDFQVLVYGFKLVLRHHDLKSTFKFNKLLLSVTSNSTYIAYW